MFYISISNGLLKNGHPKKMGAAVWEFMWIIDRITVITEKGVGKVLGGKPIKLEEICKDLGFHRDTISENLIKLESLGYINRTIAPYGIVISVNKAKKRFGRITEPRSEKTPNLCRENTEPNKTIQYDNNNKTIITAKADNEKAKEIITLFKEIRPSYEQLFRRKHEWAAARRLADQWELEHIKKIVDFLPKSNQTPYAPIITSPAELDEKYSKLMAFWQKEKNKGQKLKDNNKVAFL